MTVLAVRAVLAVLDGKLINLDNSYPETAGIYVYDTCRRSISEITAENVILVAIPRVMVTKMKLAVQFLHSFNRSLVHDGSSFSRC